MSNRKEKNLKASKVFIGKEHEPGMDFRIQSPNVGGRKIKVKGSPNTKHIVTAMIRNEQKMSRTVKYIETIFTGLSMSTTFQSTSLVAIAQGPSQSQRVADTVWIQAVDYSYHVTTANADIINTARVLILKWREDDTYSIPADIKVFNNFSNANTLSFFNFEQRQSYQVWYDAKLNLSGTATNPTAYSQHFITGTVRRTTRIDFHQGVVTGTNKVYLIYFADSSVTPFPELFINLRVWYYDE